ncbi:MAG: hypothetical protein JWP11_854 [Frankiales bacterium]|nr:hypothetical protein [Frankiales bacterium]
MAVRPLLGLLACVSLAAGCGTVTAGDAERAGAAQTHESSPPTPCTGPGLAPPFAVLVNGVMAEDGIHESPASSTISRHDGLSVTVRSAAGSVTAFSGLQVFVLPAGTQNDSVTARDADHLALASGKSAATGPELTVKVARPDQLASGSYALLTELESPTPCGAGQALAMLQLQVQ